MSIIHTSCPICSPSLSKQEVTVCTSPECHYLCPHMYNCDPTCYEYNNGHICKHIHRVHSLVKNSDLHCSLDENSVPLNYEIEVSYAESVFPPEKG